MSKYKICPKCGAINDGSFFACKKCLADLSKVEKFEISPEKLEEMEKMNIDARKQEAWSQAAADEEAFRKTLSAEDGLRKEALLNNREKLRTNGDLGYYEYKLVSVEDGMGGRANMKALQEELTKLGRDGWRLITGFTNELGKNAIVGINGTVDDTILIFERFVAFD